MTFAFYAVNLCNRIGYHFTFLIFALLGSVAAFAPMLVLMVRGKEIREKLGIPRGISGLEREESEELENALEQGKLEQNGHNVSKNVV